jgi:hypothetical protein
MKLKYKDLAQFKAMMLRLRRKTNCVPEETFAILGRDLELIDVRAYCVPILPGETNTHSSIRLRQSMIGTLRESEDRFRDAFFHNSIRQVQVESTATGPIYIDIDTNGTPF